jgi:hypothetical protein
MIAHFAAALLVSAAPGTASQHDSESLYRVNYEAMPATLIVHDPEPPRELADGITEHGRQAPALVESYLLDGRGQPLPGENAWPRLMSALELMTDVLQPAPLAEGERPQWPSFQDIYDPDGDEARTRGALEVLAALEQEHFFLMLTMLKDEQRFIPPAQPGAMFGWEFPELGQLRPIARASAARMHLAAQAGDFDRAIESFEHLLFLGRAATHRPNLIGHLLGIAIIALAESRARDMMWNHELQPRHIQAMQTAMERQSRIMPIALAYEGEALLQQDAVDMLFGPDGRPNRQKFEELHIDLPRRWAPIAGSEESAKFLADLSQRIVEASRLPTWEALPEIQQIQPHDIPRRQVIAAVLVPALSRSMQSRAQLETAIGGLHLMLALERFLTDHGEYPGDLAALAPRYLPALPPDPYTGDPYRYRRLAPGEDEHGRGYILYSVGFDRQDDGGRQHEQGAFMAATERGEGFDFIINAPPR